jgi:putative Holliday junction resolvase
MSCVLGLDVGDKTVGIAKTDGLGLTAQPVKTLRRSGLASDLASLADLCREHDVTRVVVGLPLNMDGSEGPRAALARRFARKVEEETGLPIELWDERLSTAEVQRILIAGDATRRKRREVIDTLAAQVILQGWMDARASRRSAAEEEP